MIPSAAPGIDDTTLCALFRDLAVAAGREIMQVFNSGIVVETKSDSTPVTEADRKAERVILAGLEAHGITPAMPCVAEEECEAGRMPDAPGGDFIFVDPLDGTREFINHRSDFTVNIALVRHGTPIIGVVYAPVPAQLFCGGPDGAFMWTLDEHGKMVSERKLSVRRTSDRPCVVASRSHRSPETDAYIATLGDVETVSVGSSLKFCLIAAGEADVYPRFGRTMQWDTAAGDAVLRAAGGMTFDIAGAPLTYGPREGDRGRFANPDFIARGTEPAATPQS